MGTLHKKDFHKKKSTWEWELIQEVERYGAPDGMQRERKRPFNLKTAMWPYYVTSLTRNLPTIKRL